MPSPLLRNCYGARPEEVYEEIFPDGIASVSLSHEARILAVATRRGRISLLSQSGDHLADSPAWEGVSSLVLSHSGEIGAAVVSERHLVCFDRSLKPLWDVEITGRITGLAVAPYGSHIAFATDSERLHIVTVDRREVVKIETRRPVQHLAFLAEKPELLAAGEFGQLGRLALSGTEIWMQQLVNNVGDLSLSEGAGRFFMAAFNHGVQVYDLGGDQLGTFAVDGIPSHVSASAIRSRISVLTLEHRIYWMNFEGEIQWAADMSHDPPLRILTGPLGDRLFIAAQSGRLLHVTW